MDPSVYIHGYSPREAIRLSDQASTLSGILHHDTRFPAGSYILEAGCGTGSQTVIIAGQNPDCRFHSIDISPSSLDAARERVSDVLGKARSDRVTFELADMHNLPFHDKTFDHIVICFVLEHLSSPVSALSEIRRVLKPKGTITVIEGDHGSVFFYPPGEAAIEAIGCQIKLQQKAGGNACIGRRLYPLLTEAEFRDIRVSPRMVYVDAGLPVLVDGFIKKTFTAMIEGVKDEAVSAGMITGARFDQGIRELLRTCEPDGTFSYTFFKGTGVRDE